MSRSVDVNSATADELQQVCELRPTAARTVMRFRPFHHIDELEKVPGMNVLDVMSLKRRGCTIALREPDQ